MPIVFKSKLSSQVANDTFLDKTIDDLKKGKLGLYKVSPTEPDAIEDVQLFLNTLRTDVDSNDVELADHESRISTNETDIINIEQILNEGEYIIRAFANDAAYETEYGVPPYTNKTGIYYNTTSGLLRYYDDVEATWEDVGKTAIGKHEDLGNGDGVTVDFSVSFLPLTEDSFIVYRNGTKVPRSEYTFSNPTITFNTAPSAGSKIDVWMLTEGSPSLSVTPAGTQEVIYHTMDATDISNKQITIPSTPASATLVMVDVIGGSAQQYGVDFTVSGTTLSWNGLGLESELVIGSVIRYNYFS